MVETIFYCKCNYQFQFFLNFIENRMNLIDILFSLLGKELLIADSMAFPMDNTFVNVS